MPAFTPQQYARRDEALLRLAATDRVLLARCAAAALTASKPLTHALNRLTDAGDLLRYERLLPGGLTVYTLSPRSAARLGVSRDRAELPAAAALDLALAVHCFRHLGRHPRHRLAAEDVAALFGGGAPNNVPFVLSDELGEPAAFRVVLAGNRSPQETSRYVRTLNEQAQRHAVLAPWVGARQLGIAVLAGTREQLTALEKLAARSGLLERFAMILDLGPGAEHLASALKSLASTPS